MRYSIRTVVILGISMTAGAPLAAQAVTVKPDTSAKVSASVKPETDYSAPAGAPYTAENVTVQTPMGHTLAGTLTLPGGASRAHPVGAIVTITGSGPEERDEYIGLQGYRPFRQLADSLGRRGIAVLRMDDRGTGASKGTFKGATSADFAEDIRAGLAYLRTRPEIKVNSLGVMGHSEGAVIAPMVAEKEPTLRAIVLLAGVARPAMSVMKFQMANNIKHDTALTGVKRDSAIAAIPTTISSMMAKDPWLQYFLTYDPAATARHVKTPAVLILTGANDQQADPTQVPEWAAAFRAAGNPDVTAQVVPNVSHLFAYDTNGYPGNYVKLKPPVMIEPEVVGTIVDWLVQRLH
ncbi:MAG: alpha/beta hydrolase family protein [Gemmatimonadaceae bacterium]